MISKDKLKTELSKEYNLYFYSKLNILHIAAIMNKTNMLKYVLDNGVDINKIDKDGNTALMFGSKYGHLDVVKLLLKAGANQSIKNNDGMTAFDLAKTKNIQKLLGKNFLKSKSKEFKKVVLKKKLSKKMRGGGMTPLMIAVKNGELEKVKRLIEIEGADINKEDEDNKMTALHFGCLRGYLNIVKLLIDNDVSINSIDNGGNTPLHYASKGGYLEIVKLLIDKNADINLMNRHSQTPLILAAEKNNEKNKEVVKYLINKGAKMFYRDIAKYNFVELNKGNKSINNIANEYIKLIILKKSHFH